MPGKEYVDTPNIDQNSTATAEQTLLWDGAGGVANGFNYAGSRPGPPTLGQVDGLANFEDELFSAVINNQAALIYSTSGSSQGYSYESISGTHGVWATPQQINSHGVSGPADLELWGPEQSPDSNIYSVVGDPVNTSTNQRTSVWSYVPSLGSSFPMYTALDIANAIGHPELASTIDVDALMAFDSQLIFSIKPDGPFNGGEIWYWNPGSDPLHPNAAVFLNHGGHLWDTAFGATNGPIDALEAVATPEPTGFAITFLGTLLLAMRLNGRSGERA